MFLRGYFISSNSSLTEKVTARLGAIFAPLSKLTNRRRFNMSERGQQSREGLESTSHAAKRRKIKYEGGQKQVDSSRGNGHGVPVKTDNGMIRLGETGDDVLDTLKNGNIFSDIMQEHRRNPLLKWTAQDKVSRGSRYT